MKLLERESKIDFDKIDGQKWAKSLFIICLPFYLNDFIYLMYPKNIPIVFITDYATKFWSLGFAYYFFGKDAFRMKSSVKEREPRDRFIDFFLVPLFMFIVYEFSAKILSYTVPYWAFDGFRFPEYGNPLVRWFDLTFGLFIVAFTEELLFRRYLYSFFMYLFGKGRYAIVLSAFLFSLVHWSGGYLQLLNTFNFGLMTGLFYHQKKYLPPLILIHFLGNFYVFY